MKQTHQKKIVFIVGAGHSGSTFLTKLLGQHSKVFGGGELSQYSNSYIRSDKFCSCGEPYYICSFWKKIKLHVDTESLKISKAVQKNIKPVDYLLFILSLLFNLKFKPSRHHKIIQDYLLLYENILENIDREIIIDSSKNFFNAIVLASQKKYKCQFIFLHRDGRAVLNSYQKKVVKFNLKEQTKVFKRKTPLPVSIIRGWKRANYQGLLLRFVRPFSSIKICHEKIVTEPIKQIKMLNNFMDIRYEEKQLNFAKEDHILGGNSSRVNTKRVDSEDVYKWEKTLSNENLRLFNGIAGFINKLLGYK